MKLATFIFIILLNSFSSFSQNPPDYYYTNSVGGNTLGNNFSLIRKCPDGSIIGTATGPSTISFYRIDANGNMLWNKGLWPTGVGGSIQPYDIIVLEDSTLAIMMSEILVSGGGFGIIKTDLSGNLIWAKQYANFPSGSWEISSFGSHGFMLAKGKRIVQINGDGTIANSWEFTNPGILEIVNVMDMGAGITKVYGINTLVDSIYLFDIDTLGAISNYYQYTTIGDVIDPFFINPHQSLSKTNDGKIFCVAQASAFAPYKSAVFHFDEQNQFLWGKKLTNLFNIRYVMTTPEEGCIVTGIIYYSNYVATPSVIKIDSTGNVDWIKYLGDTSVFINNYIQIQSLTPDAGSGWYATTMLPNLMVIHTDSAFNGICVYQNLSINVSNYTLSGTMGTCQVATVPMTIYNIGATLSNLPWYRYDACTGILVDSTTGIPESQNSLYELQLFPNPVSDRITVAIPENSVSGIISVYGVTGQKVMEEAFFRKQQTELKLEHLNDGVYYIELLSEGKIYRGKFMKYE
jgi:hypothetical protein